MTWLELREALRLSALFTMEAVALATVAIAKAHHGEKSTDEDGEKLKEIAKKIEARFHLDALPDND